MQVNKIIRWVLFDLSDCLENPRSNADMMTNHHVQAASRVAIQKHVL